MLIYVQIGVTGFLVLLALWACIQYRFERSEDGGQRIEVPPATAVVVQNIWEGSFRVILPGTGYLIPGRERVEERIDLRNDPVEDFGLLEPKTGDGVTVGLPAVAKVFRVGKPGTSENALRRDVKKVVTEIRYKERRAESFARLKIYAQNAIEKIVVEDLYLPESRGDNLKKVEALVNMALEELYHEWGLFVVIEFSEFVVPQRIKEALESEAVGKKEGEATLARAEAAKVPPLVAYIGEVLVDLFGKGSGKK